MTLAAFQSLVDDLVRDKDQVVSLEQRDAAIANAVARYSIDAPRRVTEAVTAVDGGHRVPLPSGWVQGECEVVDIEYPIDNVPPRYVSMDKTAIRVMPDGEQLLVMFALLVNDGLRITYVGPHAVDNSRNTVPLKHRRAVACLAAADLCGQLSSHYATESEATIGATAVDQQGKTERYRNRARDLKADYVSVVGTPQNDRNKGASAVVELPSLDSQGGGRLFHRRVTR